MVAHLQQPHGDGHGHAQRAQRPLALGDGPGVALQLPQQVRQVHVDLLHRLEEPRTRKQAVQDQDRDWHWDWVAVWDVATCWTGAAAAAAGLLEDLDPDWLTVWSDPASPVKAQRKEESPQSTG